MRRIVVTGGGTGIGKAIAASFTKAGDEVVITGRRPDPLAATVAELGGAIRAVPFDASDPAQVERALADLPGTVDVLVNNAGGNTDIGAPQPNGLTGLAAAWRAQLDADLLSAVLVTAALRGRLAPGGAVISLSSIAAHRGGTGSYGAAKAAVEAWNLTLAGKAGADQITVNVVVPGFIDGTEFFGGTLPSEVRSSMAARTATGRAGTPGDIAATVLFLASPSPWIMSPSTGGCSGSPRNSSRLPGRAVALPVTGGSPRRPT